MTLSLPPYTAPPRSLRADPRTARRRQWVELCRWNEGVRDKFSDGVLVYADQGTYYFLAVAVFFKYEYFKKFRSRIMLS